MDSILTLEIGDFRSVELMMRLALVLLAATSAAFALAMACVPPERRFALLLPSVALGAAAGFQSGVWLSWKEAFELAGNAFVVTGHLLAGEDRVIAWSFVVPVLLLCFGVRIPCSQQGRAWLKRLALLLLATALLAPFSRLLSTAGTIGTAVILLTRITSWRVAPAALKIALGSVFSGMLITFLGSRNLFSLHADAAATLVRGEFLCALSDILSLAIPAWALLSLDLGGGVPAAVPRMPTGDSALPSPPAQTAGEAYTPSPKRGRSGVQTPAAPDFLKGLFGG